LRLDLDRLGAHLATRTPSRRPVLHDAAVLIALAEIKTGFRLPTSALLGRNVILEVGKAEATPHERAPILGHRYNTGDPVRCIALEAPRIGALLFPPRDAGGFVLGQIRLHGKIRFG